MDRSGRCPMVGKPNGAIATDRESQPRPIMRAEIPPSRVPTNNDRTGARSPSSGEHDQIQCFNDGFCQLMLVGGVRKPRQAAFELVIWEDLQRAVGAKASALNELASRRGRCLTKLLVRGKAKASTLKRAGDFFQRRELTFGDRDRPGEKRCEHPRASNISLKMTRPFSTSIRSSSRAQVSRSRT